MSILSFKPSRSRFAPADSPVVADLDALIAEPIHFKWAGKKHTIKPFSQKQFLQVMNRYSTIINKVKDDASLTREDRIHLYGDLFSQCCDTVGPKEVAEMTDAQIGGLMQLIIDSVTGRTQGEASKKKVTSTTTSPST